MAGPDERLDQLLSNQDNARSILDLMQTLLQKPECSAAPLQDQNDAADTTESAGSTSPLPALALLLPQLMQGMSGDGNLVKPERVALLRAIRPYMKENRTSSLDHALRLANMTKAASAALKTLRR